MKHPNDEIPRPALRNDRSAQNNEDFSDRLKAADALAEIARWGTTDYLIAKARAEGQPLVALAAVLGLARAGDREALDPLFDSLGPMLRLLNRGLGQGNAEANERILSLLQTLDFPMVFVPAGEFLMGEDAQAHHVHLDDYWIDQYPVTNAQFQRFADETGYQAQGDWRRAFTPGKEKHPVVYVTWHDAVAFCEWAGKALPTEAQWEKAARGADGRVYPWGNEWDNSKCNNYETGPKQTTPVGSYPQGASPFGVHDMSGNVWEWCSSLYQPYPYRADDGREEVGENVAGNRVLRGGAWLVILDLARCADRSDLAPALVTIVIGFRCARTP